MNDKNTNSHHEPRFDVDIPRPESDQPVEAKAHHISRSVKKMEWSSAIEPPLDYIHPSQFSPETHTPANDPPPAIDSNHRQDPPQDAREKDTAQNSDSPPPLTMSHETTPAASETSDIENLEAEKDAEEIDINESESVKSDRSTNIVEQPPDAQINEESPSEDNRSSVTKPRELEAKDTKPSDESKKQPETIRTIKAQLAAKAIINTKTSPIEVSARDAEPRSKPDPGSQPRLRPATRPEQPKSFFADESLQRGSMITPPSGLERIRWLLSDIGDFLRPALKETAVSAAGSVATIAKVATGGTYINPKEITKIGLFKYIIPVRTRGGAVVSITCRAPNQHTARTVARVAAAWRSL